MKKRRRSEISEINISFLDVISCGFGAIVLLLIIAKSTVAPSLEASQTVRQGPVAELQDTLHRLRGETAILNRDLRTVEEQISSEQQRLARLQDELASLRRQHTATAQVDDTEKARLERALQSLTDEMQRLLSRQRSDNQLIGGIPVDSEYIIFVIDTSGSMSNYVWSRVRQEMINILDIYPQVKGVQIMSDMGTYMFPSYANRWIPDTPARRQVIINRLPGWTPFSNSSPVEGLNAAIRTFYAPDRKISIFVFGDDFTGSSVSRVVQTVDSLNQERATGERLVRIHAVGFPVHFLVSGGNLVTAGRFATLMRELSYRNGGTFVGLTTLNER